MAKPLWKTVWQFLNKLNIVTIWPIHSTCRVWEMKTCVHTETCIWTFCSITHNCPGRTNSNVHQLMSRYIKCGVSAQRNVIQTKGMKQTDTGCNFDEAWKYDAGESSQTQMVTQCVTPLMGNVTIQMDIQNHRYRKYTGSLAGAEGLVENKGRLLMGLGFLSGVMKMF